MGWSCSHFFLHLFRSCCRFTLCTKCLENSDSISSAVKFIWMLRHWICMCMRTFSRSLYLSQYAHFYMNETDRPTERTESMVPFFSLCVLYCYHVYHVSRNTIAHCYRSTGGWETYSRSVILHAVRINRRKISKQQRVPVERSKWIRIFDSVIIETSTEARVFSSLQRLNLFTHFRR